MENFFVENVELLNKNFSRISNHFSLRILQLNIRGMNTFEKIDAVKVLLDSYNGCVDVLVIGETWLKSDRIQLFGLEGYNATFSCRNDSAGGGLVVYVRKGISFVEMSNMHELGFHYIHVCLKLKDSEFDVHAVYRPPSYHQSLFYDKMESICSNFKPNGSSVIVGDMNIPVNQCESRVVREYLDLLNSYNFSVTNTIATRPASVNILDHVVCSEALRDCVMNETMPSEVSDHCFVLSTFRLNKPIQLVQLQKNIVNHTRLNEAFIAVMQNAIDVPSQEKLNHVIDTYNTLKQRFSKTISVSARVKSQCPWMSFDLWQLMRMKSNILKSARRRPNDERLKQLLTHISRKVQQEKLRAKRTYYSKLFENADQKTVWRNIDHVLGRKPERDDCIKLTIDGQLTTHGPAVADKFNEFFCAIGPQLASSISSNRDINKFGTLTRVNQSIFLRPATVQEVILKINKLNINKTPGYDGIPAFFVKTHHDIFAPLVADIFNESIASGSYPEKLKVARVVPVHKSGNKTEVNNYRPISILSVLSKLFEQLLADRVSTFLNDRKVIYDHQFGFRSGSSTWTAASELVDDIYMAMDTSNVAGVLFLDLKKAFDTIDHDILMRKLEYYGIRGVANALFRSYLTGRTQFVSVNGVASSKRAITVGVPQGSNLGPLLFLLYINDLAKLHLHGKPRLFADDTSVTYLTTDPARLIILMKEDMYKLQEFFAENLLSLNLQKTNYMIFHSRQKKVDRHADLIVGGTVVEKVEVYKYLGLIFDSTLSWTSHVDKLRSDISSFCGLFWRISKLLPLKQLITMYQAFVQSKLQYLVSIWGAASKNVLKPLQTAQNRCLRTIYGKHRLYPTLQLYKTAANSINPILALRELQTVVTMQNLLHNPLVHHNYIIRRSQHLHRTRSRDNLYITRRNTEAGKKAFSYYGMLRHNALPETLKREINLVRFKAAATRLIRINLSQYLI